MSVNFPVIAWQQANFAGGRAATLLCDSAVSSIYNIALQGTDQTSENIHAKFAIIDNTGINSTVYVEYSIFRYSVSPYTRKTFPILKDQSYLRVIVASGAVPVTLTDFDPGFPDDVNQVATGIAAGGGGGNTASFDPFFTNAIYTLSNANKTIIIAGGGGSFNPALVQNRRTTGSYYFEFLINGATAYVGLGADTQATFPGRDIHSLGIGYDLGEVLFNNIAISGVYFFPSNGDTIGIAVNLTTKRIWFRKNGGIWNNDATANPATNVNGLDWSATTAEPVAPSLSVHDSGQGGTVNTGGTTFSNPAPAGFNDWL